MNTTSTGTLTYDVFVNAPPPQDGLLPNGSRGVSPPGEHAHLRE